MTYAWATWLPTVLRAAGVTVVTAPGWEKRGRPGGTFNPKYVVWHHDGSAKGASPSSDDYIVKGSVVTPGPLAQLWVCRGCGGQHPVGTWHVLAAGRANHAGAGGPYATVARDRMNEYSLGVEVDQTVNEPWPAALEVSLQKGTAAILKRLGQKPNPGLLFHATWAPKRKTDPWGLSLTAERGRVSAYMTPPKPTTKPAVTPIPAPTVTPGEVPVLIQDPVTTDIYLVAGNAMVLCDAETRANAAKVGVRAFRVTAPVYARLVRELGPVVR